MIDIISNYTQLQEFNYFKFIQVLETVKQNPFNTIFMPQIISHTVILLRREEEPEVLILGTLLLARAEAKINDPNFNTWLNNLCFSIFKAPLKKVISISNFQNTIKDEYRKTLKTFLNVGGTIRSLESQPC